MHLNSETPLKKLIEKLESPDHLDLDELHRNLMLLSVRWDELQERITIYEKELQRELRAKIELCGVVPSCPEPDLAETLNGEDLLLARSEVSLKFNSVFCMAPIARDLHQSASSQKSKNSRKHINDVRLRAQKNL